jgi:Tfp pilus assembly protein FimT
MILDQRGSNLLELVIIIAIISTFSFGIGAAYKMENPLRFSTDQTVSFLKMVRAKAITTTSAYKIRPVSDSELITQYAESCDSNVWKTDTALTFDLPDNRVWFRETNWSLCFSARGLTSENLVIALEDQNYINELEVFLGGAVREQ